MRREALRLAQLADEQIKAGDAVTGMLLGLEAVDRARLVRDEPPFAPAAAALFRCVLAEKLPLLRKHGSWIRSAVFSPDGARVLTVSNAARLWNAVSGQDLHVLRGHEGWVSSAVFSLDGARVLTASGDGTARLWPIFDTIEALVAAVRSRLPTGELSPYQRQRFYLPET